MLLICTADTDRYEGERVAVTVAAMEARVPDVIASGIPEGTARARLLDERWWAPSTDGVERTRWRPTTLR